MMELDDIRNSWNRPTQETGAHKIAEMIGKPSQGPIAKMKRNLRRELVFVIVGFGLIAWDYLIMFKRLSIVGWFYVGLTVLFCYYFSKKNKLLTEMQCTSCRVKRNLELQLKMLEKYTRFYLISGTAIIPVLMIVFGVVFYYKWPALIGKTVLFPSANNPVWKFLLVWVVLLVGITLITWLVNGAYVNLLYGRHIKKLKHLLTQMNE